MHTATCTSERPWSSPQVKLNGGQDFINLDETLVDLKLGPEVLEVPVPRFFREDRAKVQLVNTCAESQYIQHANILPW